MSQPATSKPATVHLLHYLSVVLVVGDPVSAPNSRCTTIFCLDLRMVEAVGPPFVVDFWIKCTLMNLEECRAGHRVLAEEAGHKFILVGKRESCMYCGVLKGNYRQNLRCEIHDLLEAQEARFTV
eukprot:g41563.t1